MHIQSLSDANITETQESYHRGENEEIFRNKSESITSKEMLCINGKYSEFCFHTP